MSTLTSEQRHENWQRKGIVSKGGAERGGKAGAGAEGHPLEVAGRLAEALKAVVHASRKGRSRISRLLVRCTERTVQT